MVLAARQFVLSAAVVMLLAGAVSAQGGVERVTSHGPSFRGFSAFAVNPRDAQVVYAGSGNGVFKSTDAGESWQAVNVGLTERYVFDLAIDQHRPATLYAATGDGVFKSQNGGGSWRKTSMPPGVEGRDAAVSLALHPRNPQVIYAGTDDRVYKSGDAGASWQKVLTARRVYAIVLDPKRPATVYAGSGGGVFKSTDAGRSWKARNVGLFPNETPDGHSLAEGFVHAIVVNSRHPQTLYLGSQRGVYKSTDGARTWRRIRSAGLGGVVSSLAIDPEKPQTLYAENKVPGLFKTTNGGRRWSRIGPPGSGSVHALTLDPTDPETIYAGMFDGAKASKSTDGGRTWSALAIPVP
jgi:photosystem II stability/assembly factor-like uncharacterized protein